MDETYLTILPPELVGGLRRLPMRERQRLQELRLRCGYPASYLAGGEEHIVPSGQRGYYVDSACLQALVNRASGYCAYGAAAQLKHGFLTLPGGHRLGLCGQAVMGTEGIRSLRELSSINLRIARQVPGCGEAAGTFLKRHPGSTLIAGPPGCGKTTLLRELICLVSDGLHERVGIVDERMELAACAGGLPGFQVGRLTDILSGVRKEDGIYMLLRTMNPGWIAVDEITEEGDVDAMLRSSFCGVRLLASAHVFSREDLKQRPLYARMCGLGLFENLILMDRNHRIRMERMVANDKAPGCGLDYYSSEHCGDSDGPRGENGGSRSAAGAAGGGTDALRNTKPSDAYKRAV